MIGLDTNVLVEVLVSSMPHHSAAKRWLRTVDAPLVTTHTNVAETLRLLTHPRVFPSPLKLKEAVKVWEKFIAAFDVEVLAEDEAWWSHLARKEFPTPAIRGNEVFDAKIALTLRHHGATRIATHDSDFGKYPFLEVIDFA